MHAKGGNPSHMATVTLMVPILIQTSALLLHWNIGHLWEDTIVQREE